MADLSVKLLIEAENRATSELQKIPADVQRLKDQMQGLDKATGQLNRTYDDVLAGMRKHANAIKTEVVPAVKEATEVTTGLSTALNVMTAVAGGAGVAIGHMASVLVGQLVDAIKKTREEQELWNTAMQNADIAKVTAAIETQTKRVRELGAAYNDLYIRPRARVYEQGISQGLQSEMERLGQGQRWREYLQFGAGLEASEADVSRVTGQQEQDRIDAIKRDMAQRARDARTAAEALQRFRFMVARRAGQAQLGEYEATYRQSELADQGVYKAEQEAQERALRVLRPLGQGAAAEYELTLKQSEKADEEKFERDKKREEELFKFRAKQYEQLRDYVEANDIFAGLEKGFKDMARGAGEVMQDFARTTARGMQQSFDELFFNAMTGQFKKMGDFGRQAGYALARSFSGALSELLVGGASRGVSGLLRGGYGGLVPVAVAGGGTMLVPSSAVGGMVGPTGAGYAAGTPGGGLLDLAVGGVGSIAQYLGLSGAPNAAGSVLSLFGAGTPGLEALSASQIELAQAGVEVGSAAGAYGGYGTTALGAGLSAWGGVALAGVGFLASLYGAYQSRSPVSGAITGAISGGVLGLSVGTALAAPYGGSLVGLVAGAALGAGAGALGSKGGRRRYGSERRSADAASAAVQGFSGALNQAQTGEDLLAILNRIWAPNDEFIIRGTASDGSSRLRNFTYADLFDPDLVASLTVYAGVTGRQQPSFELAEALKGKIAQIAQTEGGVQAAYQETGPGLSRTTFLPFGSIVRGAVMPGTQAFFFSTEAARNQGATDAILGSITRGILRVSAQQDLVELTERRFLDL